MGKSFTGKVRSLIEERSEGLCEAMIPGVCQFRANHVHHRKLRSQGGTEEIDAGLHLCHQCHSYIHMNPAWSYERGLLIHGWDEVSWPPKYYRGIERKEENDAEDTDDQTGVFYFT